MGPYCWSLTHDPEERTRDRTEKKAAPTRKQKEEEERSLMKPLVFGVSKVAEHGAYCPDCGLGMPDMDEWRQRTFDGWSLVKCHKCGCMFRFRTAEPYGPPPKISSGMREELIRDFEAAGFDVMDVGASEVLLHEDKQPPMPPELSEKIAKWGIKVEYAR